MCAILDNDVVHEVFGSNRSLAGKAFFKWIDTGSGNLVIGGKLLQELDNTRAFREWRQQALLAGRVRRFSDEEVNDKAEKLKGKSACQSNDEHVIALAQISNARLLYSNDVALRKDFDDKKLIDKPRGKVYSTLLDGNFRDSHKKLLRANNLCRRDQ